MNYQPGTHLIATLTTLNTALLHQFDYFQQQVNAWVITYRLQKLGEVYHNFSPSGFTGVVCLSESHLSIHTWPEYGRINLDIYLSNHERKNDGTVKELYQAIRQYFEATAEAEQIIIR